MARYELGVRTPAAAAGAPYATILAGSGQRMRIQEIGVSLSAATASSVGLIRTLTVGTATTSQIGAAADPADSAAVGAIATAWSTAPTIAATPVYLRRFATAAAIGPAVIWTWPSDQPLVATNGATTSLVLWNFGAAAGAVLDIYIAWAE